MKLAEMRDRVRWVSLPEYPGVRVCLLTTDNVNYRHAVQQGVRQHRDLVRRRDAAAMAQMDMIILAAVGEHLLHGWKGIEDNDGNPIAFSREMAVALSEQADMSGFFHAVLRKADELAGRSP